MSSEGLKLATRHDDVQNIWYLPRLPGDGPPDEVRVLPGVWKYGDGTVETDPIKIAALEAQASTSNRLLDIASEAPHR